MRHSTTCRGWRTTFRRGTCREGRFPATAALRAPAALARTARLMRSWPGLEQPARRGRPRIRRTQRDYETFGRMEPGDRYPQAIAIATDRVRQKFRSRSSRRSPAEDETLSTLLASSSDAASRGTAVQGLVPEWWPSPRKSTRPIPEDKFVDKWRKLIPGEPSWTVTAHLGKDSYSHIHYDGTQKRAISVREAARLQSFPDSFAFKGNMGDCYRQIGNAVPPLMAWALPKHCSVSLDSREPLAAGLATGSNRRLVIKPNMPTAVVSLQ